MRELNLIVNQSNVSTDASQMYLFVRGGVPVKYEYVSVKYQYGHESN